MNLFVSQPYYSTLFVCYLIGSFPTAYFMVRYLAGKDIRQEGSGSVGGRNTMEVTGKFWAGAVVTVIDILKGVLAVMIAIRFVPDLTNGLPGAMFGVVMGHCFPVWLKFEGGRGLATAAGVFLMTLWPAVPLYLIVYVIAYRLIKDLHVASAVALVVVPFTALFIPPDLLIRVAPIYVNREVALLGAFTVTGASFLRHIEPLFDYFYDL